MPIKNRIAFDLEKMLNKHQTPAIHNDSDNAFFGVKRFYYFVLFYVLFWGDTW